MSTFKTDLKYWLQIFLLPVYWLSFLSIRDRKIWIFGSTFGKRFADNPKYMFLYLSQFQRNNVRPIWISRDKSVVKMLVKNGYETYYHHSLKGIFYCLKGGVYLFDNYSKDISFWLSGGAQKVNLWHGTATKKINQDNKFDYVRHPRNKWEWFLTVLRRMSDEQPSDYILATSYNMAGIMSSAFQTAPDHVLAVGHPRNDILFPCGIQDVYTQQEKKSREELKICKKDGKKCIFYTPTFRDTETMFLEKIDFIKFNQFLVSNGYMLFSKLHVKSKLKKEFASLKYTNIRNIPAEVDPATVLEYADMLIVDYSSIYLDYMMLERPVVAFPFDYQEYLENSRECYFDYEVYMPERKVYTMEDLMTAITEVFQNDTYKEKRIARRAFHFDDIDGNSSKRLYNAIQKIF